MLQFISRQSLRSVNTTRCAVLVLWWSRRGIALWVDAEKGRCAVNCVHNRLQQSATLELMCWDFPVLIDRMNEAFSISLANQSQFTWQEWSLHFHFLTSIAVGSRGLAMKQASFHCLQWQRVMHEKRAMNQQYFLTPFWQSSSVRIPGSRRAKTPCERTRHRTGWDGGLDLSGVVGRLTDCVRAPNLCPPQQRAFCFGAPLYFVDAVLEERRLQVTSNLLISINQKRATRSVNFCHVRSPSITCFFMFLETTRCAEVTHVLAH